MSKYPVEQSDDAGQVDALNYLLSGPGGLGQNFQGVRSYKPTYLTGFFRAPFTVSDDLTQPPGWTAVWPPRWYFNPISITNITPINVDPLTGKTKYIKIDFATQATPPFAVGQQVYIQNVVDSASSGFYNDYYATPGATYCTTTYVILATSTAYIWPSYVSGGDINTDQAGAFESTDCNARVFVTGGTDSIFITNQNEFTITYECFYDTTFTMSYVINRYYGFLDQTDPNNPDYRFILDDRDGRDPIIVQQTQEWNITVGTGTVTTDKLIFTPVLDQNIPLGYYWYIAEVRFDSTDYGDAYPVNVETGLRSLTAQVIKQ